MDLRFEVGLLILILLAVGLGGVRVRMIRRAATEGAADPKAGITRESLDSAVWVAARWLPLVLLGAGLLGAGLAARWTGRGWGEIVAILGAFLLVAPIHARMVANELRRLQASAQP